MANQTDEQEQQALCALHTRLVRASLQALEPDIFGGPLDIETLEALIAYAAPIGLEGDEITGMLQWLESLRAMKAKNAAAGEPEEKKVIHCTLAPRLLAALWVAGSFDPATPDGDGQVEPILQLQDRALVLVKV